MNKLCTSIEQSKKLLELGLSPETADMEYIRLKETNAMIGSVPFVKDELEVENSAYDAIYERIPCWSLTALLELMPLFIRINNEDYNFSLVRGGAGAYTFSYTHNLKEPWELGYDLHLTTHKDSVINAAFEMVCWLIEQEYIKVNK